MEWDSNDAGYSSWTDVDRLLIMKFAYFDQQKSLPATNIFQFNSTKFLLAKKISCWKSFPDKNFISSKDALQNFESNDAKQLAWKIFYQLPVPKKWFFDQRKKFRKFFQAKNFLLALKLWHGLLSPMMYDTWLESPWSDLQTQLTIWFPIKFYFWSKIKKLMRVAGFRFWSIVKKLRQEPDFWSKLIKNENSTYYMISDQNLFFDRK